MLSELVTAPPRPASSGLRLSKLATSLRESELLQIHNLISRPGILSFALGMPGTDLLPAESFQKKLAEGLLSRDSLQYRRNFAPLQRHIVEIMARRGVRCREEEIFICSGSQQALYLLGQLLLDPGSQILVEEITYEGLRTATASYVPEVLTVPTSLERGIDLDAVEDLLTQGASPAFLNVIPEGHNPMGVSLAPEPRRRLVELARRFGTPIVEDDAYGLLSYEGEALPALRSLDDEWIFYVGSLSKVLAPALRVGWIVAPVEIGHKLSQMKHSLDLYVMTFASQVALSFFESGDFPVYLQRIRKEYGRRRDVMLRGLEEHFPASVRWSRPRSGLYIWVELAPGTDTTALLERAVEEVGVAFCPGPIFSSEPAARSALRLCFGSSTPEEIARGIRDLGRLIAG